MANDREIWERFKAGDKSALSYIYFQNFNSMFQYGIKFKEDPEFIKDCIQDVFYKLIQAGEKLSPTENIRYYMFRALKNTIYKELNKGQKMGQTEIIFIKFDAPFSLEEELSEKENINNKEKALLEALSCLSNRQREAIYLRYECGMEYDKICEIMELKNDSARKLVFRAIKSLKEIIESQLKFPILLTISIFRKHAL